MRIRFEFTGVNETVRRVHDLPARYRDYIESDLRWFGETVSKAAKEDHPYQDRTGQLTASIGFEIHEFQSGRAQVIVFATMPYAEAVEYGTPTSRPYPYLYPKFYQYLPELMLRLQASLDRAFEEASDH